MQGSGALFGLVLLNNIVAFFSSAVIARQFVRLPDMRLPDVERRMSPFWCWQEWQLLSWYRTALNDTGRQQQKTRASHCEKRGFCIFLDCLVPVPGEMGIPISA